MSRAPRDWACWALNRPQDVARLDLAGWDRLLPQAVRADLVARLAAQLQAAGLLDAVPAAPQTQLRSALQVARAQHVGVLREVALVAQALAGLGAPVLLLKGAAYVAAGLPAAQGRLLSDVDILVPRAALAQAESLLMLAGWMGQAVDAYDARYYREWMHEIPPMLHARRATTLDVHHNILPLTLRRPPDAALLLADAVPVPGHAGLQMLAPPDMVLHSMAHLFHNDDLSHALRDLSDLDLLLRHFSAMPGFWPRLAERAAALHLQQVLAYGLWATAALLATPVPAAVQTGAAVAAGWRAAGMHALWRRALRTPHADAALPGQGVARFLLYLRAHALRMPPLMLARHLGVKAWKRWGGPAAQRTAPAARPG